MNRKNSFLLVYLLILIWCTSTIFCQKELFLRLFTKKDKNQPQEEISVTKENASSLANYMENKKFLCWINKEKCTNYFIEHGFISDSNKPWVHEMKDELFKKHENDGLLNVFLVDWPAGSLFFDFNYFDYVKTIPSNAIRLNEITVPLVKTNVIHKNTKSLNIHCIGHSLGAQMCGIFGKQLFKSLNIKLRRISGLDPAGPKFEELSVNERLNKDDALLVDVIHTSRTLGFDKPIGHIDFYPNWDQNSNSDGLPNQPGCFNILCNHGRAYEYFTASINSCEFLSHKCSSFKDYLNNQCTKNPYNNMGFNIDIGINIPPDSMYFLLTSSEKSNPPFCGLNLRLFTKKDKNQPQEEISVTKENASSLANYMENKKFLCWINKERCTSYYIIHGFFSNSNKKWVHEMKDELFKKHENTGLLNVFLVDWPAGIFSDLTSYEKYAKTIPSHAKSLGDITVSLVNTNVLQKNTSSLYLHCIGHSLGAQMCGIFGKQLFKSLNIKLRRISGLDPAGPKFEELSVNERLNKDDALLVDVIHTSRTLGFDKPMGHIDFYPNWDPSTSFINSIQNSFKNQPGCENIIDGNLLILCNHGRAYEYFNASINSCHFKSHKCSSFKDYLNNKCTKNPYNYMGLNIDIAINIPSDSMYFLKTSNEKTNPPFCEDNCKYNSTHSGICTKNINNHVCSKSSSCNKQNENANKYRCCYTDKKKVAKRDLTFLIDFTASKSLTSELFTKSIDFVSNLIKRTEVSSNSTQVALIGYSSSIIETFAFFNDNFNEKRLLSLINTISLETKIENSKSQLSNALKECQKIFTLKNGMRESSKGFGKQIILVSGEVARKDGASSEILKKLESQGIF